MIHKGPEGEEDGVEDNDGSEIVFCCIRVDGGVDGFDDGEEEVCGGVGWAVVGDDGDEEWWEKGGMTNVVCCVGCQLQGSDSSSICIMEGHEVGEGGAGNGLCSPGKDAVGVKIDGGGLGGEACEGDTADRGSG